MRYGSVCSGIEAATVAWHPLDWQAAWFSEIEPFPCAVLKHHYPTVPNYGDMTKFEEWPNEPINLLVGGTPCQSFSVAGLRKGLADPRGNLMLTFGAIARRYRPEWLVWENVPGVLSANGGRDFGTFLGMLGELGYGFAYRVLDAQYFGVAQRRRRVFVVANARGWQRAAAVLFESHSLQGHPAPRREAGKDVAGTIAARFGSSRKNLEEVAPIRAAYTTSSLADYREGVGTLRANGGDLGGGSETLIANTLTTEIGRRYDGETDTFAFAFPWQSALDPIGKPENISGTLIKNQTMAVAQPITQFGNIAGSLTARHDSSPCADRGQNVVAQPVASDQTAGTLRANPGSGWRSNGTPVEGVAIQAMQVRRLTPVECERLQGFPDNYTNIPWRGRSDSPDGPRYKALGNSMAVPVMRWLNERIHQVDKL